MHADDYCSSCKFDKIFKLDLQCWQGIHKKIEENSNFLILLCGFCVFQIFTELFNNLNWKFSSKKYSSISNATARLWKWAKTSRSWKVGWTEFEQAALLMQVCLKFEQTLNFSPKKLFFNWAASIFTVVGMFFLAPAVPKILDIAVPLNESRPLVMLYQTEYFVDEEKYYVYILLHAYMSVSVSVVILVYFDVLLGTHVHHACAMFTILR